MEEKGEKGTQNIGCGKGMGIQYARAAQICEQA